MILKIALVIVAIVVLLIAGLAGYRPVRQHQAAQRQALKGPSAINEAGFVRVGGIDQWVSIRGEDRSNPVLVLLHGGPGTAFQLIGYEGFRSWERDFTVVQWDQRGAGRTFGRNGKAGTGELTIDRMSKDGIEVIQHALSRSGQDKALVLGISWGSILGVEIARRRPDLLHAYVGGGQVVDMARNEIVGYAALMAKVRAEGDAKAEARLTAIGPPPYADLEGLIKERAVLTAHAPSSERGMHRRLLPVALSAPDTGPKDILDWLGAAKFSTARLYKEMMAYSDQDAVRPIVVPVVVIQGDQDIQTPTVLARAWFDKVQAPKKDFVLISGGGHNAVLMMPEAFHAALTTHARPLAAEVGCAGAPC